MNRCNPLLSDRRNCFWSTQSCSCGADVDPCGGECCRPGLSFDKDGDFASLSTDNWITGLIINILNTDKRVSPTICGVNPGAIKGHWSESFIDGSQIYGGASQGFRVGTAMRQINTSGLSVNEIKSRLSSEISNSLQKLVYYGIATSIDVSVEYSGNYKFSTVVNIYGPDNAPYGKVSIISQRDENAGFYWSC